MGGLVFLLRHLATSVYAHDTGVEHTELETDIIPLETPVRQLDEIVASYSVWTVYAAAASLGLLILIAIAVRYPSETLKRILFWSITGIISISTGLLIGMTVYLNQVSVTKGPVHWHADFQIWACDKQQDLIDPQGLSNRVGTPTLHEHNDNRIHVEGVVVDYPDANVGSFFRVIGGNLTGKSMVIPTVEGKKSFVSGQKCNNSDDPAVLQTFILEANLENKTYSQRKIENSQTYQFKQEPQVPPGDCIIFEFGKEKERTERICQTYSDALVTEKLLKEVPYEGEINGS